MLVCHNVSLYHIVILSIAKDLNTTTLLRFFGQSPQQLVFTSLVRYAHRDYLLILTLRYGQNDKIL